MSHSRAVSAVAATLLCTMALAGCATKKPEPTATPSLAVELVPVPEASSTQSPGPTIVGKPDPATGETAPTEVAQLLVDAGTFIAYGLADGSLTKGGDGVSLSSSQGAFGMDGITYFVNPEIGAFCVEKTEKKTIWRYTYQSIAVEKASCADPATGSGASAASADVTMLSDRVKQLLVDAKLADNADTAGGTLTLDGITLKVRVVGKTLTADGVFLSTGSELQPSFIGNRGAFCVHVRNSGLSVIGTENGLIPTAAGCAQDGSVR